MVHSRHGSGLKRVFARAAALVLVFGAPMCLGILRSLWDGSDSVDSADLDAGGACQDGCVRTVVDAVALSIGEVDCDLRVENLLDHTDEDVLGGALNVVHSCTDGDGELLYQGQGACLYSVCVTAEWRAGKVFYGVVVEHEASSAEHTVRFQIYLNEYADLQTLPDLSFESISATTSSNALRCQLGTSCPAASDCGSGTAKVEVALNDDYGDGWTGALPNRTDTWTLTNLDSDSIVAEGTLPEGHFSGITTFCLEDGVYNFDTTGDVEWSSESTWNVCGVDGAAGGSLEFEVGDSACNVLDDSGAGGPADSDAETSSSDMCSLPSDSPCVAFNVGVMEASGPSVGMYYDESCLDGGGGWPGCSGGGEQACRVCFVNRDLWLVDFPDERYPDWVDCPCCVADALGVTCQPESDPVTSSSGEEDKSLLEKAEAFYWEGSTPVLAGLGGLIGLGLITACCCCRDIRKTNQKALSYKHYRASSASAGNIYGKNDPRDDTSADVTPPLRGSSSSTKFPALGESDRNGGDLEAAETAGPLHKKRSPTKETPSELKAIKATTKARERSRERSRGGSRGSRGGFKIAPDATEAPDLVGDGTAGPERLMMDRPIPLPGSAKYHPASDASWPSDPRVGMSVSGKKHPRWSGGRELKNYLRKTGHGDMVDDAGHQQQQRKKEPSREGRQRSGRSGVEGGHGRRVVRAIKRTGSILSRHEHVKHKFSWSDDPEETRIASHSVSKRSMAVMEEVNEVPVTDHAGILPPPPATRAPKSKSRSRSRSKSRDNDSDKDRSGKSHPRGGSKGGGMHTMDDYDGTTAAPFEGTLKASTQDALGRSKKRSSRAILTDDPEPDVPRSHAEPSASARSVGRGRGAEKEKEKPRGRRDYGSDDVGRGGAPNEQAAERVRSRQARYDSAALTEVPLEGERERGKKATRPKEEDNLRGERARKRREDEEEAARVRERKAQQAQRREEEEEEKRRQQLEEVRRRREQREREEKERAEAEERRAEEARRQEEMARLELKARRQQQQLQKQLEEEDERQRRQRRRQEPRQDRPDENGRGRSRGQDQRQQPERGRSAGKSKALEHERSQRENARTTSKRATGDGTTVESRDERRRGGGRSTSAGPGAEARETEAERRRRLSRERDQEAPGPSRGQEVSHKKSISNNDNRDRRESSERAAASAAQPGRSSSNSKRRSSASPRRRSAAAATSGRQGEGQEAGNTWVAADTANSVAKTSASMKFSSDPRAKQERATKLKQQQQQQAAY